MLAKEFKTPFIFGAILAVVGAFAAIIVKPSEPFAPYVPYVFGVGAFFMVVSHILTFVRHRADSAAERRQQSLTFIISLALAAAAYFMFHGNKVWVVCLMVYAVSALYLSFRK